MVMNMTKQEVLDALKSLANEKYKANVVKLGIPEEYSLGVSTGDVRKLAKGIKKSNELAYALWESGYHEAKLLAVLLFDKKHMTVKEVEQLMQDVISWDLCDHLCKNLILKVKGYEQLIQTWCQSEKTYVKRAGFTLIASAMIHETSLQDDLIEEYLQIVKQESNDSRDHVKKAASWALREIGKYDFQYQEKAIVLAHELIESGNPPQVWIGKDALKELETLVKVEGRSRLIRSSSAMGKEKSA